MNQSNYNKGVEAFYNGEICPHVSGDFFRGYWDASEESQLRNYKDHLNAMTDGDLLNHRRQMQQTVKSSTGIYLEKYRSDLAIIDSIIENRKLN